MVARADHGSRSGRRFVGEVTDFGVSTSPGTSDLHPAAIWITWEQQRRTTELARAFGIRLFRLLCRGSRWLRYPVLSLRTLRLLARERPQVLFVQNPSLILALVAGLARPIFRYRLIVDRHTNFALNQPPSLRKSIFTAIGDLTLRRADLTIVTNQPLASLVESRGGRAFVLPDRLPDLGEPPASRRLAGSRNICFICTFAEDEPFDAVIQAAADLPVDVHLHVTGRIANARLADESRRILAASDRIVLTDFLPEAEYVELLHGVDVVVDLTTFDHCLVCGAYEAIAAGKALVLSDSQVNRELFEDAPVFVGSDRESILTGLERALAELEERTAKIVRLRTDYRAFWEERFEELNAVIARLAGLARES